MATQFVKCFQITDWLRDIGNWNIDFIPTIYALGFWREQFSFIHAVSDINLLDVFSAPNRCALDFRLLTPVDLPWCCDIYFRRKFDKAGLPLDVPEEHAFKRNIFCREEAAHAIFLAHQKIFNQTQNYDSSSDLSSSDNGLSFTYDTVCIKVIGCRFDFSFVALPPFPYSSSKMSEQLFKRSVSFIQPDNALPIFPLIYSNDESTKVIFSRLGQANTSKGIAVVVKLSNSFNRGDYCSWDRRIFKNVCIVNESRSEQPIASSLDQAPNPCVPYATLVKHVCLEFVHKFEASIPIIRAAIESTKQQLKSECSISSSAFKMNLAKLINDFSNAFNDALSKNDEEGIANRVQQHLAVFFASLSKSSPTLFIESCELEDDVPFTLVAPLDKSKYWHFTSDEIDSQDDATNTGGFFAGMLANTPLELVKTCQQNWDLEAMAFFEIVRSEIDGLIVEITDEVVGQFPGLVCKFKQVSSSSH
ncbi:hypothetical protein DSO57_1014239 [Entomophthora muscae]|uniref:Uncharacterized protein n=1 Tax=Entomophthora muscae TaxID=34485 RepID=A0ACC2TGV8_9FUNG|nr:hypothetical protein DSO57_1014239 [Entomophthora muscae]